MSRSEDGAVGPPKTLKRKRGDTKDDSAQVETSVINTATVDEKAEKAARKERKRARKAEAATVVQPADDVLMANDVAPRAVEEEQGGVKLDSDGKAAKKARKEEKKRRKEEKAEAEAEVEVEAFDLNTPTISDAQFIGSAPNTNGNITATTTETKAEKKARKAAKKEKKAAKEATKQEKKAAKKQKSSAPVSATNGITTTASAQESTTTPTTTSANTDADASADLSTETPTDSKSRFIVFIGNLPFSTTTASLTAHFSSIHPDSIRHITDKETNKSKGFAFLEFTSYDRMRTCLKLYHHSMFDDGSGKERGKRRINVELTAGGGGKGENRMGKVKERNERLAGQRERKAEAERKEKERAEKKGKGKGKKDGEGEKVKEAAPAAVAVDEGITADAIHPARMALMNSRGPPRR